MPAFDGTGPMGYGPITGRSAGLCGGFGRGMLRGFGGQRGCCPFFASQHLSKSDERSMLTEEVQATTEYLKNLEVRLKELGNK